MLAVLALGFGCARGVEAACNAIPGTIQAFRGARGTVDRPFVAPGDFVTFRLKPDVCDAGSTGFSSKGNDHVVTVLFEPPGGAVNVVVVAKSCNALAGALQACQALPEVASATCVPAATGSLEVRDRDGERRFLVRFPDSDALLVAPGLCVGGGNAGQPCGDDGQCPGGECGRNDDRTFTGPATIAVTDGRVGSGNALVPCELATQRCADTPGLVACVDELYTIDGTCQTDPVNVDRTFGSFTALPPPNRYEEVCISPDPPCTGTAPEMRLTTDAQGNALVPVDWSGVLVNDGGTPIPRLVRGNTAIEAFTGLSGPLEIPGNRFIDSYAPEGRLLPAIFDAQFDQSAANELTLFGSADARYTVLRLARRKGTCAGGSNHGAACTTGGECPGGTCPTTCFRGANDGAACSLDGECPGGKCGALFEFRDRYEGGSGPVVIPRLTDTGGVCQAPPNGVCTTSADCVGGPCVDYRVEAQTPVPLEGLTGTEAVFAFTKRESIEATSLNGDSDAVDSVVEIRNRLTGASLPTGAGMSLGRAVARIQVPPLSIPAVASSGDVVAFLESETAQGVQDPPLTQDANGNGLVYETNVRVFRETGGAAIEMTDPLNPRPVDASPVVNRRSLAAANGRVYVRAAEGARGAQSTIRMVDPGGTPFPQGATHPAVSADGRWVAFTGHGAPSHIYVYDRASGTTRRVSIDSAGVPLNQLHREPVISADGRFVAFQSFVNILVHDRDVDEDGIFDEPGAIATTCESDYGGGCSIGIRPQISADGRFVAFQGFAGVEQVYLRDRAFATTTNVSYSNGGEFVNRHAVRPRMTADGRFVYHLKIAEGFPDNVGAFEGYVYDRMTGLVTPAFATFQGALRYAISPDGRYLDFNGVFDLLRGGFVGPMTGLNVNTNFAAVAPVIAFVNGSGSYVPDDSNGIEDAFVADLVSGDVARMSVTTGGNQATAVAGTGEPSGVAISGDGRVVAFTSYSTDLVPGDVNGEEDVFVRGPAYGDGDLTGDGDSTDIVLQAIDGATGTTTTYCPAGIVKVSGTDIAFLRPETQGDAAGCPAISPTTSLNGDGDRIDDVVHLAPGGGAPINLRCAAADVALSSTWVAALVSEEKQGDGPLNGDGDDADLVARVRSVGAPAPASCADWTNVGPSPAVAVAADAIDVVGDTVALITPESGQNADATGDGDLVDRVVRVYDAATETFVPVTDGQGRAQPAEEFVLGTDVLAFRTREYDLCNVDTNGSSSCAAPEDCTVACDPNVTPKCCDLNGDGDCCDDVLQAVDLVSDTLVNSRQAVSPCAFGACDPNRPYAVTGGTVKFITNECDQGHSELLGCPDGGRDLNGDDDADIVLQVFKVRTGTVSVLGPIGPDGSLVDPLQPDPTDACPGTTIFPSVGRCVEVLRDACVGDATCPVGTRCGAAGRCERDHGVCLRTEQCPGSAGCRPDPITPASGDADCDQVADAFDNCPAVENPGQEDLDDDDVGDACDLQTCGNGVAEFAEPCDGVDDAACPGACAADCVCPCTNPALDPKASVKITTKNGAGKLGLKMSLPLGTYGNDPVSIRVEDDGGLVAKRSVGVLPPKGGSGKLWQFKTKGPGVNQIQLKNRGAKFPGEFLLQVKAARWLDAALANEGPSTTRVIVTVGPQCFVRAATKKID